MSQTINNLQLSPPATSVKALLADTYRLSTGGDLSNTSAARTSCAPSHNPPETARHLFLGGDRV